MLARGQERKMHSFACFWDIKKVWAYRLIPHFDQIERSGLIIAQSQYVSYLHIIQNS